MRSPVVRDASGTGTRERQGATFRRGIFPRTGWKWLRGLMVGIALVGSGRLDSEVPFAAAGAEGSVEVGQGDSGMRRGRNQIRMPTPAFRTEVPARAMDLLLGRPTRQGISLSVLAWADLEGQVVYGTSSGAMTNVTPIRRFENGKPQTVDLAGLLPNTRYQFEFRQRPGERREKPLQLGGSFQTARPAGAQFTFTVQADSHLDYNTDPAVYAVSLSHVVASRPDFHIDLGDTFMTDKYLEHTQAETHYLAQRYYLGKVGVVAPVYLVLGNHDGEGPGRRGETAMGAWSNATRKRYFPNPEPDGFYSGNEVLHPDMGRLQDYYAWEWGEALFVVLDPFWYSTKPRGGGKDGNNWWRSLGRAQYEWLRGLLATSTARHTFVFTHHLVGGATPEGRGGVEASRRFEWGGEETDGERTFAIHRPGWSAPIHDLLARRGRVVVFHGHDHLYVHAERDGVVYQEVPQPGHPRATLRSAEDYGYREGTRLAGSGFIRVSVSPDSSLVEYVRADATGTVADRYTLPLK